MAVGPAGRLFVGPSGRMFIDHPGRMDIDTARATVTRSYR